jgi:uncharacterized protein YndB with AHSA1/START domain
MEPARPDALGLFVERRFPAARQRVFDIWTDPDQIKIWFGGPQTRVETVSLDLRVGGRYVIQIREPDGSLSEIAGEFLQVQPPSRLVYTWEFTRAGVTADVNTVSVEFIDDQGLTVLRLEHHPFYDPGLLAIHQGGWEACLLGVANLI